MYYSFQIWHCNSCGCSFHELGVDLLHYWMSDGEFHSRPDIDEECIVIVEARPKTTQSTQP